MGGSACIMTISVNFTAAYVAAECAECAVSCVYSNKVNCKNMSVIYITVSIQLACQLLSVALSVLEVKTILKIACWHYVKVDAEQQSCSVTCSKWYNILSLCFWSMIIIIITSILKN